MLRPGVEGGVASPTPAAPLSRVSRAACLAELATGAACTGVLLFVLRHLLFPPVTRTFGHDLIFWYPIYQHYAEGLSLGHLRLWNPLSHGGEPLYPALFQLRAFDPLSFGVIVVGDLLTSDLLARYNWDVFLRAWIPAVASCVFLRRFADHAVTRLALIPATLFSSFLLVLLRVHGAGQGFLWAPLIAIFLHRVIWLGDGRWRNFTVLAIFMGLNFQSYFFVPHLMFAVLFAGGVALWHWPRGRRALATPRLAPKLLLAAAILGLMLVPLTLAYLDQDELVLLTRVYDFARPTEKVGVIQYEPIPSEHVREFGVLMPLSVIRRTGTPSTMWNFLQLVTPTGNWHREGGHGWGNPSEAFMYPGLLVYAGALAGLVAGRHPQKRLWLLILGTFGLLMLGPLGGFQSFLAWVFPFVRLTRHTHTYTPYFQLALLFFFVIGCNRLVPGLQPSASRARQDTDVPEAPAPRWAGRLGVALSVAFLVYLVLVEAPATLRIFSLGKAVTPLVLALGLAALWWLVRRLAPWRMFWVLLLGHLVAVPIFLSAPVLAGLHTPPADGLSITVGALLLYWGVFLGLPLLLWVGASRSRLPGQAVLWALSVFLLGDLVYSLTYTDYLWHWPRPDRVLGVTSEVRAPAFTGSRELFPKETARTTLVFGQAIRYPELLLRRPYLFTAPRSPQPEVATDLSPGRVAESLERARLAERWNSFFVPRRYLALVHSGTPAPVLASVYGLGEPLVRLAHAFVTVSDADFAEFFRRLGPEAGRCLLAHAVVLDRTPGGLEALAEPPAALIARPCPEPGAAPSRVSVTHYTYDTIGFQVSAPRPGFLYFSDGFHPRWTAYVDGRPVPVLRANLAHKAVPVPAGTHDVLMTFDPRLLGPALVAFHALGLAGAIHIVGGAVAAMVRLCRSSGERPAESRASVDGI